VEQTATTGGTTPQDRYVEIAALWVSAAKFKLAYAECRRNLGEQTREQTVEKYPTYYGGIRPGSVYWPRIPGGV
jgi:hypothetical protein